jgi:hypothetical protein
VSCLLSPPMDDGLWPWSVDNRNGETKVVEPRGCMADGPRRLGLLCCPFVKNKQRHAERQRATTVAMGNKLWRRTNFSENSLSSTALAVDDL